ncbi:MAG: lysozyme inhibitor LprI family protein, partial [Verrucomicrobiota bacterium]|nr:lysozyme inhibitor LprI family protein [Verrucomicrobiota bacterium]
MLATAEGKEPTLAEAKAAFAKADRALNEAWNAAKNEEPHHLLGLLTLRQREWLEYRDSTAREASKQAGQKESKQSAVYFSTAAELMETRSRWLHGRARPAEDTLTGLWIDAYGGTLRIVQQEKRLLFVFDVVRGPTFHSGAL